jgi:hypothetical protein
MKAHISASIVLALLTAGCRDTGSELPSQPVASLFCDSFSKVKVGMFEYEVDEIFGKKGREIKNVPDSWPRTLGEVPDFEKIVRRHFSGSPSFAGEKIWWLYWTVRGPHKWVAVGICRTNVDGGSLTMPEVVMKKSGLDGPEFTPR